MRFALVFITALAAAGCLERAETITVRRDGSADVTLIYKGGPGDFDQYLHFPAGDGWKVEKIKETENTDQGPKEVWKWTATKTLKHLEEYPDTFAPANTPNRDRHFQYTTTLRVTEAHGLRTYEFERVYPQTANAEIARIDEASMESGEMKTLIDKMHEKGLAGLSEKESRRFFELAASWEREKQMAVAERAVEAYASQKALGFDVRQEMRARIGAAYREILAGPALEAAVREFLGLSDEAQRVDFAVKYLEKGRNAAVGACEGIAEVKAAGGFASAYAAEETAVGAGAALMDDRIKLRVKFPCRVVAGNSVADPEDPAVAIWEFDGKDLKDGRVVLRAVAVERVD